MAIGFTKPATGQVRTLAEEACDGELSIPPPELPDRRHLYADARGSIVLVADKDGATIGINSYDEYGIPVTDGAGNNTNTGRFQYTGQIWLQRLGMYYYKARIYSPTLGRFMQTDPIGYEDQFNLYAYVGNDPINAVDPSGTEKLILFSNTEQNQRFITLARNDPNRKGVLGIYSHGSSLTIDGRSANQIASVIRDSGQWNEGMPIVIFACNTASNVLNGKRIGTPIAKELASILETEVTGANSWVWVYPSGKYGGVHNKNENGRATGPDLGWTKFRPSLDRDGADPSDQPTESYCEKNKFSCNPGDVKE